MSYEARNIEFYILASNVFALRRVVDHPKTKASLQHVLQRKWLFPLQIHSYQTLLCRYSSAKKLLKTSLEWTSQPQGLVALRHYYMTHTRLLILKGREFSRMILYSLGSVDIIDEQDHASLPL